MRGSGMLSRYPTRYIAKNINTADKPSAIYKRYQTWIVFLLYNGTLARCVKFRVAHAPGIPGTFSPPPRVSDPDMHHSTCATHVPWCMPGSLASGFPWSRWRGKRSRHSRRMRNPQFYVSGKRPMHLKYHVLGSRFAVPWASIHNKYVVLRVYESHCKTIP